jgi:predicted GTPase
MIRGATKIRAAIAMVLLSIPYGLLFAAGSIWLFQTHLLLGWAGCSLAFTAVGWYLLRGLWQKAEPPRVQPDLSWPPQGMEVWKQVEHLAVEIEGEALPLDQPEKLVAVVRRVVDVVARHYHPDAADPWLETPFPHVLRIVELVARDLRQATLEYVPGSHILTIADLRRLQKLAGMAHRSYFWYRIASFVINTPAAFLREARDTVFGELKDMSTETARRWAVGYFVRRTGYYAIQLYGSHLALDDAQPADAILRQSRQDTGEDLKRTRALDKEPLRIVVVGQKKSGKSSLINALFGQYRAATDVVPRTDHIEPYVLDREGLQQAIILDTAGYDVANPGEMLRPLIAHLHGCDIVICVCSAASAAREADRRLLSELRAEFQRNPDRHMPVMITALTHIDRLRPLQEWNPPYRLDPAEGRKAVQIVDAIEAVATDLAVPPADVIPVCLLPERMYNVEEALAPAMLERLPAAQRVKYVRCLRQQRDEQHWRRLGQQTVAAGRVLREWMRKRPK